MRKIKFRVWNQTGKRMLYDSSLEIKGNEIVSKFVMQFTGLKDKKGKDIYEGDLLLVDVKCYNTKVSDLPDLRRVEGIVIFDKGCFLVRFNDCDLEIHPNYSDVIGNKFENTTTYKRILEEYG